MDDRQGGGGRGRRGEKKNVRGTEHGEREQRRDIEGVCVGGERERVQAGPHVRESRESDICPCEL